MDPDQLNCRNLAQLGQWHVSSLHVRTCMSATVRLRETIEYGCTMRSLQVHVIIIIIHVHVIIIMIIIIILVIIIIIIIISPTLPLHTELLVIILTT